MNGIEIHLCISARFATFGNFCSVETFSQLVGGVDRYESDY